MRPFSAFLVTLFASTCVMGLSDVPGRGVAASSGRAFEQFMEKSVGAMRKSPQAGSSCSSPKGRLVSGETVSSFLGDSGSCVSNGVSVDLWSFSASAGEAVTVTFNSTPELLATIQDYASGAILLSSDAPCSGLSRSCSFTFVAPSSSKYYLAVGSESTGSHTLSVSTPSGAIVLPNLIPYRVIAGGSCNPPDLCSTTWSDRIVVSRVPGTHTDSTPLATTDTLYVDWAVQNAGDGPANSAFNVQLFVDGALFQTWQAQAPFSPDNYVAVQDYAIGSLGAGIHTIRIKADSSNSVPESNESDNEYTKTITVGGSATCSQTATALCLNSSRFRVSVSWITSTASGNGTAVLLTGDTGYFWFFSSGNVEVVVKVVDGRALNNKFWVFAGGLTNVDTTITITDTVGGTTRTYRNPANTAFQPIQDTSAF